MFFRQPIIATLLSLLLLALVGNCANAAVLAASTWASDEIPVSAGMVAYTDNSDTEPAPSLDRNESCTPTASTHFNSSLDLTCAVSNALSLERDVFGQPLFFKVCVVYPEPNPMCLLKPPQIKSSK